jgi:hypothetical protein
LLETHQFDDETLEKMRACTKAEFPICLDRALTKMFGAVGKKGLDSFIINEGIRSNTIASPKNIWNLYERYIERSGKILGNDVAQIIQFENLKEMKSMLCSKCPLYERELERQKNSGKSQ